jgi:flagellin
MDNKILIIFLLRITFQMSSILTNYSAMGALQALRSQNAGLQTTEKQVSSGLRVQVAADNAAYWSVATTMRSDRKAISAVSDALGLGAAMVDTAYEAMNSVVDRSSVGIDIGYVSLSRLGRAG